MIKSKNLGLNLTENEHITFKEWRESIDGYNEETNKSNMQIIDEAIGNIGKILDKINGEVV